MSKSLCEFKASGSGQSLVSDFVNRIAVRKRKSEVLGNSRNDRRIRGLFKLFIAKPQKWHVRARNHRFATIFLERLHSQSMADRGVVVVMSVFALRAGLPIDQN
jgi:hypothetical protein